MSANGSQHAIYMVKESSYGVTPTNPALILLRNSGTTLGLKKDSVQSEEIRSDRQISDVRLAANQVAGDLNIELSYGSFDDLLPGVLVSPDWDADTPAVGTDQLKAGTSRHSYTIIRHFSDIAPADKPYMIFRGVELDALDLTLSADTSGAIIKSTFKCIGQSMTKAEDLTALGAPTYPAPSTTPVFDSFTAVIKENGNAIGVVTELTLSVSNGAESRFVVGSKNSLQPSLGRSNVTGQMTVYFESGSLHDKFLNETYSSSEMEMLDSLGNKLNFKIPKILYTSDDADVSGETPITAVMPFQALLDPVTETNLIVERTAI